jgi:hypothetical protein
MVEPSSRRVTPARTGYGGRMASTRNPLEGAANRTGEEASGGESLEHVPERSDQVPNENAKSAYGPIRGHDAANPELSDPISGRPSSH